MPALLQHVTGFFRARLGSGQQEFAQPLQGDLSFAQQLGQVAQGSDRGFQFLISGLPQPFPHALQQRLQLFGRNFEGQGCRLHLDLLQ
jgi:hypothetical protein